MKRRFVIPILFCVAASLSVVSIAQEEAPTPPGSATLDAWVGSWSASGTLMGRALTGQITWQWGLGGWFLHGESEFTMTMEDGAQRTLYGGGFLKPMGDGTYEGHWALSNGQHYPMAGRESDGTVVVEYTDGGGPGRRTISLQGDTATANIERQDAAGAWVEAGTVTYTRQTAGD